jgi:hypothetical protein
MEDGQLVELDDNVTFPGSSTFVSDITDESPLAGKLWNILCQATEGLSTGDLQKACGLSSANDLIALLSRWERNEIVRKTSTEQRWKRSDDAVVAAVRKAQTINIPVRGDSR